MNPIEQFAFHVFLPILAMAGGAVLVCIFLALLWCMVKDELRP